jgi:GNAT superfamily N-acetyltransferase
VGRRQTNPSLTPNPARQRPHAFHRDLSRTTRSTPGAPASTGASSWIVHFLVHASTTSADVCYLQDLFTAPDARGKGVAGALIAEVERWAREQGCLRAGLLAHAVGQQDRAPPLRPGCGEQRVHPVPDPALATFGVLPFLGPSTVWRYEGGPATIAPGPRLRHVSLGRSTRAPSPDRIDVAVGQRFSPPPLHRVG